LITKYHHFATLESLVWFEREPGTGSTLPHNERPSLTSEKLRNFINHRHQHTMEIKNPRRILALGAPESGVLKLLSGKCAYIQKVLQALLTRTRAHRFRPRAHIRLRRRPNTRMAPRNQILHRNPPNMGRRDPRRIGMANSLYRTRGSRSHNCARRMDILLP
jgi:hypothetical protein